MHLGKTFTAAALASALVALPAVDLQVGRPVHRPHPVTTHQHSVDLSDGSTVSAAKAGTTATAGTTIKRVTLGSGSLVGVSFDGAAPGRTVQVRVQDDDGSWGGWNTLEVDRTTAPDPGTPDAAHAEDAAASDPLWVGRGSSDRQVEVKVAADAAPGASLAVVDPGTSAADASVTATDRTPAASASAATSAEPVIHSRADWGADESLRRCAPSYATTTRAAVLHHTADTDDYTAAQVPAMIRAMYRYHVQTRGWCDLAYNVLVDKFGGIWEGRAGGLDRPVVGAHTGGFNDGTFGVAMIGNYQSTQPTPAELESVAEVMAWKLGGMYVDPLGTVTLTSAGGDNTSRYARGVKVTLPVIFGHRDVGSTLCPGADGYADLPWIRQRVAALIGAPSGTIYSAWQARGGASGPLGYPSSVEASTPTGGRFTHFAGGSIYSTAATGTHAVSAAIRDAWGATGWESGPLGYPTSDTTATPNGGGTYATFQGGSVYSSSAGGAHAVTGVVLAKWGSLGWENGSLGFPSSNVGRTPDGRATYQHFVGGSIYSTSATGTHAISSGIRTAWGNAGWEGGALGYPTSDTATTPNGKATYAHFQGGMAYTSGAGGSHALTGVVLAKWGALGWENGFLGLPSSDVGRTPDGRATYQHFVGGSIYSTAATGTHAIDAAARTAWGALGWEDGALGYPTTDTTTTTATTTSGGATSTLTTATTCFQHGTITTTTSGGTTRTVVTPT